MTQRELSNAALAFDVPDRLPRQSAPHSLPRRLFRRLVHYFSYHLILRRPWTAVSHAAGFRLSVPPTVFHPRFFLTSEYFAAFISRLDLAGLCVAEVGTGSGVLALAAARAGASQVVALDINPNAAAAAHRNARANGFGSVVSGLCSNLLSALRPEPMFDVVISSPPSFPGEPRDLADRAWHAGPGYRDVALLFEQVRDRLMPGGRLYVLFSSDSDLGLMGKLIDRAGFRARIVGERSLLVESFILYELRTVQSIAGTSARPSEAHAPAGG